MMVEITKGSDNIFEDLGFVGEEANALQIKADLMIELEKTIKKLRLSQVKAAKVLGIARPRLNQMMNGRLHGVTIDKMVDMISRTGRTVSVTVKRRKTAVLPQSKSKAA